MLLIPPNAMDCKTPTSHRGSTLLGQRLFEKFNENCDAEEQTTLHDVLGDADRIFKRVSKSYNSSVAEKISGEGQR